MRRFDTVEKFKGQLKPEELIFPGYLLDLAGYVLSETESPMRVQSTEEGIRLELSPAGGDFEPECVLSLKRESLIYEELIESKYELRIILDGGGIGYYERYLSDIDDDGMEYAEVSLSHTAEGFSANLECGQVSIVNPGISNLLKEVGRLSQRLYILSVQKGEGMDARGYRRHARRMIGLVDDISSKVEILPSEIAEVLFPESAVTYVISQDRLARAVELAVDMEDSKESYLSLGCHDGELRLHCRLMQSSLPDCMKVHLDGISGMYDGNVENKFRKILERRFRLSPGGQNYWHAQFRAVDAMMAAIACELAPVHEWLANLAQELPPDSTRYCVRAQ